MLACGPLVEWLRRRRLPNCVALLITLVVSLVALGLLTGFLIYATAQCALALPTYAEEAKALGQQVQTRLHSLGLDASGSSAIADTADVATPLNLTYTFLSSLHNVLSNGVMLLMLMVFLFVDVVLFPGRLAWHAAHGSSYARRVGDCTDGVRQYIIVMTVLGVLVGAFNTGLFPWIGGDHRRAAHHDRPVALARC